MLKTNQTVFKKIFLPLFIGHELLQIFPKPPLSMLNTPKHYIK